MSHAQSFATHPQPRLAISDRLRASAAQHTPRQNRLLAALSQPDYEKLRPHLYPVSLPVGATLYAGSEVETHLYFPTSGIVSRLYITKDGDSVGFAITGLEGAFGIASFLGGGTLPSQVAVLSAGYAYRLRADYLAAEFDSFGALAQILMRYAQSLITQVAQAAACNRHHSLAQQLCCWLLSWLDRSPGYEVGMTQERIAEMLGVRREGVAEAAGHLRMAGLIRYGRGCITVLDRRRLEEHACECYSVVKRECDRLIPEDLGSEWIGASAAGAANSSLQAA
jgi:CRP-like cAMP-binding protein